jgi:hypothetical protein
MEEGILYLPRLNQLVEASLLVNHVGAVKELRSNVK